MIEYEDIFEKLDKMGSLKTVEIVEMTPLVTEMVTERNCRKCRRWNKTKCSFQDKILNPDNCCCGWYKDKEKVKTIRGYRRIK